MSANSTNLRRLFGIIALGSIGYYSLMQYHNKQIENAIGGYKLEKELAAATIEIMKKNKESSKIKFL